MQLLLTNLLASLAFLSTCSAFHIIASAPNTPFNNQPFCTADPASIVGKLSYVSLGCPSPTDWSITSDLPSSSYSPANYKTSVLAAHYRGKNIAYAFTDYNKLTMQLDWIYENTEASAASLLQVPDGTDVTLQLNDTSLYACPVAGSPNHTVYTSPTGMSARQALPPGCTPFKALIAMSNESSRSRRHWI